MYIHHMQNGSSSLMRALCNKHEAATELLLAPTVSAGALDAQNSCKLSALMYASSSGLAGMVSKLLALGADAALTDKVMDDFIGCHYSALPAILSV
jgi:ankyrin repeat protein